MRIHLLYVNGRLEKLFTCSRNLEKYVVENKIEKYTVEIMWAI